MLKLIAVFCFKLAGWKTVGEAPASPKYIIVVGPHTSGWDFIYGIAARTLQHMDTHFIGKAELFRGPFGWIFRSLGGYPVDRSRNNNLVEAVVEIFESKEKFSIAIAPEGTRQKARKLKTGFWHMAKKSGIPLYMAGMDFPSKTISFEGPMELSEDKEADLKKLTDWLSQFKGKNPELGIG